MERPLQSDQELERPKLEVDLTSGDRLPLNLIAMAQQQLTGHALASFNQMIWAATQDDSGKTYADLLEIISWHMDLTDTSGRYTDYAPKPEAQSPEAKERPQLRLELVGTEGTIFTAIARTQELLEGDERTQFTAEVATALGIGMKQYHEVLDIIQAHVELVDTSWDRSHEPERIMAAIHTLNSRLHLLPPGIESEITGLYPELDNPDLGPDKYGVLLEEELQRVEHEMTNATEDKRDDWLELHNQLTVCMQSLRRAGVNW